MTDLNILIPPASAVWHWFIYLNASSQGSGNELYYKEYKEYLIQAQGQHEKKTSRQRWRSSRAQSKDPKGHIKVKWSNMTKEGAKSDSIRAYKLRRLNKQETSWGRSRYEIFYRARNYIFHVSIHTCRCYKPPLRSLCWQNKMSIFSCEGAALEVLMSVCLSVRPQVEILKFQKVPEGSRRFQKVPECSRMFQNVPEDYWTFLKVPEHSWRFLHIPEGSCTFLKVT